LRVDVSRHAVPVAQAQEDARAVVQLAQQRLQFVAAVAVEQQHLADALALHRIDQVGEDAQQRRRRQAARQRAGHLEVVGVDAVGDRGQQ
jgi:hypothetical protein